MRFHLLGLVLLTSVAAPAIAQTNSQVERRIERLERDLQNMQRRSAGGMIEPEIRPQAEVQTGGIPASTAVADLTARLDSLERQLARLTGTTEEYSHRVRQLEDNFAQYRRDAEARIREAELARPAAPAAEAEPQLSEPVKAAAAPEAPSTGDEGEDAYLVGFRQWEAKEFDAAQKSLEAAAKKFPKHRRASYALNLAGRAYLDDGKPATAAKLLLSNYQSNPKGERAADSLYFLGQALMQLKKPAEACKVYDELQSVYPTMRDWVKQRLPQAREEAKCSS